MTSQHDWSRFSVHIFIDANVERVFRSWTQNESITKWFVAESVFTDKAGDERAHLDNVQSGDQYTWTWMEGSVETGRILEVVDNERIRFSFGKGDEKDIAVTVTFSTVDGLTRVDLIQEGMSDSEKCRWDWHMGCRLGWSFFLTNLKAFLEHKVDLREKEPERAKQYPVNV